MIKGIPFDFGNERTLIIAPLSLGSMEKMREKIEKLQGSTADPNSISTVIDLAHASLTRNYPELTRDDVAELVDLGNMSDLVAATMATNVPQKQLEDGGDPAASDAVATEEVIHHG